MNHYVANPFTIHQRLYIYIYISLYRLPRYFTPYYPYYPRRENHPWRFNRFTHRTHSYTPCHLSRYLSIVLATYVYDTPHIIVPISDSLSSLFDPSSRCSLFLVFFFFFFTSIFQIRYDNDWSLYRDGKLYRTVSSSTRAFSPYRLLDYRKVPITLNRFVLLTLFYLFSCLVALRCCDRSVYLLILF